jgi:sulfonate transport system permease protein
LLPLLLLALWQVAAVQGWVDANILASPWAVLLTTAHGVLDGSLMAPWVKAWRAPWAGCCWAAGLGFALGLWLGLSRRSERLLGPTLAALRQIAIFAWVPLLTAWFGLGELAKGCSSPSPRFSRCSSPPSAASPTCRRNSARPRRCCAWGWPAPASPGAAGRGAGIFAGLRLSLIYAWLGTIGAEYFMPSNGGIGSQMIGAQQLLRMDLIMAGMLLVGLTGALLNLIGQRLEIRATRWRHA